MPGTAPPGIWNDIQFEEVPTERVEVTGKRRKRKTDSLAPFAPFCATHPFREQENVLSFSDSSRWKTPPGCAPRYFRATCFHLGDLVELARVRPPTTFIEKSHGENGHAAAVADASSFEWEKHAWQEKKKKRKNAFRI
ncbi:unnamed protein product [Lasius platythorax]|uniref:Uncharacterized protein n=1 Tax=Lasius platythorax TaxID=488582 RepID=A0AAV2N358_9HYME